MSYIGIALGLLVVVMLVSRLSGMSIRLPHIPIDSDTGKKLAYGGAGILCLIILGVILYSTKLDVLTIVVALLFLVAAVLGLLGKGGAAGKTAAIALVILIIAYFAPGIYYRMQYGEGADIVIKKKQEAAVEEALRSNVVGSEKHGFHLYKEEIVQVETSREWSVGKRIPGGACVSIKTKAQNAQLSEDGKSWMDWEKYPSEKDGEFFRVRSDGKKTEIHYEFRRRGHC